jgi:hypothetical protein
MMRQKIFPQLLAAIFCGLTFYAAGQQAQREVRAGVGKPDNRRGQDKTVTFASSKIYTLKEVAAKVARVSRQEVFVDPRIGGRKVFISAGRYEAFPLLLESARGCAAEVRSVGGVTHVAESKRFQIAAAQERQAQDLRRLASQVSSLLSWLGETTPMDGIPFVKEDFLQGRKFLWTEANEAQRQFLQNVFWFTRHREESLGHRGIAKRYYMERITAERFYRIFGTPGAEGLAPQDDLSRLRDVEISLQPTYALLLDAYVGSNLLNEVKQADPDLVIKSPQGRLYEIGGRFGFNLF